MTAASTLLGCAAKQWSRFSGRHRLEGCILRVNQRVNSPTKPHRLAFQATVVVRIVVEVPKQHMIGLAALMLHQVLGGILVKFPKSPGAPSYSAAACGLWHLISARPTLVVERRRQGRHPATAPAGTGDTRRALRSALRRQGRWRWDRLQRTPPPRRASDASDQTYTLRSEHGQVRDHADAMHQPAFLRPHCLCQDLELPLQAHSTSQASDETSSIPRPQPRPSHSRRGTQGATLLPSQRKHTSRPPQPLCVAALLHASRHDTRSVPRIPCHGLAKPPVASCRAAPVFCHCSAAQRPRLLANPHNPKHLDQ